MQTHTNVLAFYARWDKRLQDQNKKWTHLSPGTCTGTCIVGSLVH
jgi:hypothetical protein